MNITQLRSALREKADIVPDHGADVRIAKVQARIRRVRRRRVAGAAALTVAVLVLAGAVTVVVPRGGSTGVAAGTTEPAQPPPEELVPVAVSDHFVSHSGEFDLIDSKVGKPGESALDFTFDAPGGELHVAMLCYGTGSALGRYWISGWSGERPQRPYSTWCGGDRDTPGIPGAHGTAPGPWNYDDELTMRPDRGRVTVQVELTNEVDENGVPLDNASETGDYVPVTHPGVVLAIGVYRVAEPVTTVAGTEIHSLVGLDGQDYAYQEHRASKPGARELTWRLEPSPTMRYYDFLAADAMFPNQPGQGVEAVLDGTTCRSSYAFAKFRAGGCLLTPGEPHTITVRVIEDSPETVVLGIVLYGLES